CVFADVLDPQGSNSRIVHLYSEQPDNVMGNTFEQCFFANGRITVGGESGATAPRFNEFLRCLFWKVILDDFKRQHATKIKKSKLFNTSVRFQHQWGAGDQLYSNLEQLVRQGNEIYSTDPDEFYYHIAASRYGADGTRYGPEQFEAKPVPPLRTSDKSN